MLDKNSNCVQQLPAHVIRVAMRKNANAERLQLSGAVQNADHAYGLF